MYKSKELYLVPFNVLFIIALTVFNLSFDSLSILLEYVGLGITSLIIKLVKSINEIVLLALIYLELYSDNTKLNVSLSLPSNLARSVALYLVLFNVDSITFLTKFKVLIVLLSILPFSNSLSLLFNIKLTNSSGFIVVVKPL